MDSHANTIEQKLRQAWSQERRFIHLRGVSRFVIWLIVMIVVDFIIDWGIVFRARMTGNMGLLLLGINVAVLGWVLWHEWLRHLKPYNSLLVALEVESRHPELSSLLVSYAQLDQIKKNQPNVSGELVQAMAEHAVIRTKPLDFREIVDFGQLTRLFTVAGCVLLLFAVISFSWPDHMRILLERLAGGDAEYPTQTQIVEVNYAPTVKAGDSIDVLAVVGGVVPEHGLIYTRAAAGAGGWSAMPMAPREQDGEAKPNEPTFGRRIEELTQDVQFYVRIGDDQSEVHRLHVVNAPRIEKQHVALVYPSYMRLENGQDDQLNVEAPAGTDIQCRLSCDMAVRRVLVKTDRSLAFHDRIKEAIDRLLPKREDRVETEADAQAQAEGTQNDTDQFEIDELRPKIEGELTRLIVAMEGPLDEESQKEFIASIKDSIADSTSRLVQRAGRPADYEAKRTGLRKQFIALFAERDEFEAAVEKGGKEIAFAMRANSDFTYTFLWTEGESGEDFQYDDVQYSVSSVADSVPDIELLQPGGSGLATANKTLTLTARASDDYGLSQAWLVYSVSGDSEERRVPIRDFGGAAGEEFSYVWPLSESIEELQPGMQVSLRIDVDDLHPDEHIRRSATRQLTIVEPERYLQWYRTELAAQHDEIKRARAMEQVSSAKVKEIKIQEGDAE